MLSERERGNDAIELAVVVPCFNERDNVAVLVDKLTGALHGIEWEVIFVDDNSPDGTATLVRELAGCESAGTLYSANRSPRLVERSCRRNACEQRTLSCGDRRRSAA